MLILKIICILIFTNVCDAKINVESTENEIQSYSDWIVTNFPIPQNPIQCIDIVYTEPSDLINKFISIYITKHQIPIRLRTIFSHAPDNIRCDFLIFISSNFDSFFQNIKSWSLGKRFKYFLIIFPNQLINVTSKANHPSKWIVNEVLYHPNVMLIYGHETFKLSSPYQKVSRHFIDISIDEMRNWKLFNVEEVKDFGGLHMNVCSTNNPPHHFWIYNNQSVRTEFPRKGDVEIACQYKEGQPMYGYRDCQPPSGISPQLTTIISEKLNFSWSFKFPQTGEYGREQPDGSENGCVGDVMFGNTDMSFYGLWVQYARNTRVELTYPFYQACNTFLVPRPEFVSYTWTSIFMTLPITAWIGLLASFLLIIASCFVYEFLIQKLQKHASTKFGRLFIEVIGIPFNNSIALTNLAGVKVLLSSWTVFSFFSGLFYSTVLIAHLTIPTYTRRIDTSEDFVARNLSWGLPAPFESKYYYNPNRPSHFVIKNNFRTEPFVLTPKILKELNEGKYAVALMRFRNKLAVLRQRDDLWNYPLDKLRVMKFECLNSPYFAFGFQNNSPFVDAFNRWMHRFVTTGIFDYILRHEIRKHYPQYWESIYVEYDRKSNQHVTLTFSHIRGAFYVLWFGLILGCACFIAEMVFYIGYPVYSRSKPDNVSK